MENRIFLGQPFPQQKLTAAKGRIQSWKKVSGSPQSGATYNMLYFVDILVLTMGLIPKYGFGVTCWGYDPISMLQLSFAKLGLYTSHGLRS